jgi:polyhydroxyalkanoate synthesis regulator protein
MVPLREPVTIRLYGNRRLYRPTAGRYVTFDEVVALATGGTDVVVRDAQTGADVTEFILSRSPTEH